ncbi:hypothetical protein HDU86_004193 [Geranomyces michiganensis]|nr:hypothetical protein HDU86_004193 [Geranomyces michiganensis]
MKAASCILLGLAASIVGVSAHGKLTEPLGLNVDPRVDLNSQADVAIGVSAFSACGSVIAAPPIKRNDMAPRASFAAGSTAQIKFHIVNQDGAGPLSVAFSPDNGKSWTSAKVTVNAPGRFGVNLANSGSKGEDAAVSIIVPEMACPAGSCLLQVRNPITFGSCSPVEITPAGTQNKMIKTYTSEGGKPAGSGLVGIKAGPAGVVDPLDLPGVRA